MSKASQNLDSAPWVANNGLRVESRTSQGFHLKWSSTLKVKKDKKDADPDAEDTEEDEEDYNPNLGPDGPWHELQMKKGPNNTWKTVYKGYGMQYEMNDLVPDATIYFRMKRNGEKDWGSTIVAATDSAPPFAEDLQRAVACNAEDMIIRIIESTKKVRLRKLLESHDPYGMTPLMISCYLGTPEIVEMLIEAGAQVNATTEGSERTPLMFACMNGDVRMLEIIRKAGAKWEMKDRIGCSALHYAVNADKLSSVRYAVEQVGPHETCKLGWTPLLRSVIVGHNVEVVKYLLSVGADPNAVDNTKVKSCLIAAVMLGRQDVYVLLLAAGADPTFKNANGQTAYDIAISLHDRKAADCLCERLMAVHEIRVPTDYDTVHSVSGEDGHEIIIDNSYLE